MDLVSACAAVAAIAATGAVQGVSEDSARSFVEQMRRRMRHLFNTDRRSQDALECACETPNEEHLRALTEAMRWYADRDEAFAGELREWAEELVSEAGPSVRQEARAGRDAYTAGRDMTVQQRPEPP
jgi:hypothetical protein